MSPAEPESNQSQRLLLILLVVVCLLKWGFAGHGLFALEDEGRYTDAARAVGFLGKGDWKACIDEVFSTQGRPGDTLVRMAPNAVQFLTARLTGRHIYEPANTYPLFAFNFAVYVLTLWVLVRLAEQLLGDRESALLVAALYAALIHPQFYLRHALPYDMALLVLLFVLERLGRRIAAGNWALRGFAGLGGVAYLALAIYPGFYPFVIVPAGLIACWRARKGECGRRFRCLVTFGGGAIAVLVGLEGISRLGGRSYLAEMGAISDKIKQGSFDEALWFPFKYLIEVEGGVGYGLLLGWAVAVAAAVVALATRSEESRRSEGIPVLFMTSVCVGYGVAGYLFHGMVYYGRLLHPYYPFLCIAAVASLGMLRRRIPGGNGPWLIRGMAAGLLWLAINNHRLLTGFAYPSDVVWTIVRSYPRSQVVDVCEFEHGFTHVPGAHLFRPEGGARATEAMILVNACVYHPVPDLDRYSRFEPSPGDELVVERRHFVTFRPYLLEGYTPSERELILKVNPTLRVYRRAVP